MRYPETRKEDTHARIVEGAAEQLRTAGVNGIGVADLMRAVGLTHGGFYAHFESKEALVAEALGAALEQTMGFLRAAVDAAPKNAARQAIVETYLSARHRDHADKGCGIAALGADISRLGPATRSVFEQKLEEMIALVAEHSGARADARRKAIGMIATMAGALVMARAVKSRPLSDEILEAARETV